MNKHVKWARAGGCGMTNGKVYAVIDRFYIIGPDNFRSDIVRVVDDNGEQAMLNANYFKRCDSDGNEIT